MVESLLESRWAVAVVAGLLIAAALLGSTIDQPLAATELPQAVGSTGAVFARALGGVRSAAAAYLWIKLDDAHHQFYSGDMRKEQPLMPLFRIATWLDPRLERAYYVGSYMLWLNGKSSGAIEFAREGLRNNPDSVILTLNLGQLHLFQQGVVAKREAMLYLTLAEKMSRGMDRSTRLQVLGSLDAAYKKWKVPREPKAVIDELARLRAWARSQRGKADPHEHEHEGGVELDEGHRD